MSNHVWATGQCYLGNDHWNSPTRVNKLLGFVKAPCCVKVTLSQSSQNPTLMTLFICPHTSCVDQARSVFKLHEQIDSFAYKS